MQDNVVTGMVFNKQGEPLVGVYVRVTLGRKVWTAQTDNKGAYRVKLPAGTSWPFYFCFLPWHEETNQEWTH